MSFIVLLLLGITTFVRVESSAAAQSLRILEARQNAMLGMQIALGELQAAAGPDQRVTAKADLFNNTHETRRHLTGVWNTTTGNFQQWLVSDFNRHGSSPDTQAFAQSAAPNPANDDTVVLLGPGSLDSSGGVLANAADAVVVGMANTGINATNRLVGRYAWWIDDEGVKARINLDNPFFGEGKQPSVLALNSFNRGEVGFLTDFSGFNLEQDEVSRVSSIRDLSLSGVTENNIRRRFFDFTTWSAGVLADVVDGRLKRDLSLAFELPDGDFNDSVFSAAGPRTASGPGLTFDVQPIFYCSEGGRGPTWHLLRDYYTIYKRITNPMTDPVFTAQVFSPNNEQLGVVNDNWQTFAAMRFHSDTARTQAVAGDPLRSSSLPIPVTATYAPYVNRHLINFGVKFEEIPSPSGTTPPGWDPTWLVHTPSLWMRPQLVMHNPFNIRVSHPGFFTYNDHLRFDVRFRSLINNEVRHWRAGQWWTGVGGRVNTQGNWHLFRVEPGAIDPGELKIFEGLVHTNNDDMSANTIGDYFKLGPGTGFTWSNQTATPVIPYDPAAGTGANFQVEFLPFGNNHWANWVYHNMGRQGSAVTPSNTIAAPVASRNFPSNTNNFSGARLQNVILLGYKDWWEAGPDIVTQWSGNYMEVDGSAPYDFFNFDTYLKPAQHLRQYPTFTHTNPLAINHTDINLFPITAANWEGYPVLDPGWQIDIYAHDGSGLDIIPSVAGLGANAFWGPNHTQVANVSLVELPTTPVLSLGKLQNANLSIYGHMPLFAVGNSFASPFINITQTTRFFNNQNNNQRVFYDLSYLANEALWDSYFFSSYSLVYNRTADAYVPVLGPRGSFDAAFDPSFDRAGVLRGTLPNSRMQLFAPRETLAEVRDKLFRGNGDPALRGYDRAAENLLVAGSFNIHSTSVEAWRSVLSAARNLPVYRSGQSGSESYGSDRTPLSRLSQPTEGPFNGSVTHRSAWGGFSALTDSQIDDLARAIVEELKLRVNNSLPSRPFMGLAEFVNRKLINNDFGLAGLLQAAIDKSGINSDFSGSGVELVGNMASFPAADNIQSGDGSTRSAASSATAKILQGTILQAIGSFISPRSDTFRIRSYGEVISATPGGRDVKAWAEAVYQRVPEPVVPSAVSPADQNFWVPQEIDRFGRRFVLVSFRWLTEDEV